MQIIAQFDKFGATYKPKLKHDQENYKTVLGGAISLTIYLISFVYFSYKIYQFGSNQMNPIQSLALEYKDNYSMFVENDYIKIFIQGSTINPFNQTNQILVPSIFHQGFNFLQDFKYFSPESIYGDGEIDETSQIFQPKNLSLSNGNSENPISIILVLAICDSQIHMNCSDEKTIEEFFNQNGLLVVTQIITEQYNSFTNKIEKMTSKVTFALDRSSLFYQRIIMTAQILEIDQAPLLQTYDQYQFFSDFQIQTQSLGSSFKTNLSGGIFVAELSMSQVTQKKVVQFIKISQVLADVGSIFSSLMLLSLIVSFLNETWMEQEIINQVIGIYYPQFLELKIKRHCIVGSISQVSLNNKEINLDSFQRFYKKAKQIAIKKLSVYSSIYEISRLQFALQGLISRDDIKNLQKQGIGFTFNEEGSLISPRENYVQDEQMEVVESQSVKGKQGQPYKFQDEDFDLLDFNFALQRKRKVSIDSNNDQNN